MEAGTIKQRATVLLVEDDPADQALTRRAFDAGEIRIDLRIVGDGQEALEYLHGRGRFAGADTPRPDLVLMDLNLPGLDGRGLLAEVRATEELCCLPVVALTTSMEREEIALLYELGVNSYIVKPPDLPAYISALRELSNYWFNVVRLPR